MKRTFLLGILLLGTHLSAFMGCGDFGGSIDYLYWKPAGVTRVHDRVEREFDSRSVSTVVAADPTYDSGVRGEAWWRPECSPAALVGRFYWVEAGHSQTFRGDVETISIRAETDYYAGDLLVAYGLCCSNCLRFDLLAGGEFLYVANPFSAVRTGDFLKRAEMHARTSGGGATVGFAAVWRAWCALELFGEARCGLVFGSTRIAAFDEGLDFVNVLSPFSAQEWTREWDLRLGGRYAWSCGCAQVGLQAGWEARAYLDLRFPSSETIFDPGVCSPGMAIGGPFIGITGSF